MSYLGKKFNLKNKIAVVTGGLGFLGTEYCKALIESGVRVAVFDLKDFKIGHPLAKFSKKGRLMFLKVDITDKKQVEKSLKSIKKIWGVPQILINNAALDFPPNKVGKELLENYPLEKWNAVMSVNLTGTLVCCQVIGGAMARSGGGSIINISSIYGLLSPDQRIYKNFIKPVSYSVSKSGVLNLTRYLATYWARKGVRVNTLSPGGVFNNQDAEFIKKFCEKIPLGRMAAKEEYNGAVLFLASDASSYMTGANLIIDGGWTAW